MFTNTTEKKLNKVLAKTISKVHACVVFGLRLFVLSRKIEEFFFENSTQKDLPKSLFERVLLKALKGRYLNFWDLFFCHFD